MIESGLPNPRAVIGGNFANSKQMLNDASAGISKTTLPSTLDRFRSMLKERDEVRLSLENGVVSPPTIDEVVRLYEIVLSDLTFNSKPIITDLTIIAGEHRQRGEGIADAICTRILEAPVEQKLPSLYLLDSIVKNIGREYIRHFSARLPEVFCEAYRQVHPNMIPALRHLFGTWSTVFPSPVLCKIEACLQFSPSTSHQSSGLTNMRASESPQPSHHGIHVNPKYLEARRQLVGAEKLSSAGHAGLVSSDVDAVKLFPAARSSSPYGVGRARSISPPVDDFDLENSPRFTERDIPSHARVDCGLGGVLPGADDTIDCNRNHFHADSIQQLENSVSCSFRKGVCPQGPRALINAYGIDEREKEFSYNLHKLGQPEANGNGKRVGVRTWINAEEEEFNWEDMSPTLGNAHRRNDISSSMLPPGRYFARPRVGPLQDASTINESRRSLPDQTLHSLPGRGDTSKISGLSNEVSLIPASNYSQESHYPVQSSQQLSHHHIRVEGGGKAPTVHLSGAGLSTGEHKHHLLDLLKNVDGNIWRPPRNNSSTSNLCLNSPIQDAQLVNVGISNGAWTSPGMHNPQLLNSIPMILPRKGTRDQYDAMKAVSSHARNERHMDNMDLKPQFALPRLGVQHPGAIISDQQRFGQIGLSQPPLHCQDHLLHNTGPLGSVVPTRNVAPKLNFLCPRQGHGGSIVPIMNIPNHTSLEFPRAAFRPPPMTRFTDHASVAAPQMMPTLQTCGQSSQSGAPSQGSSFSSLISTLMAQGLISLSHQGTSQDSIGTEFNVELLKERHESTIAALYSALPRQCTSCGMRFQSQDIHSSHMDWHVTKNRISKNRKQNPSRKWFVSLNMWLSSAEALGTDVVPGFLPVEDVVEKKDGADELAVPADDDQNACALCGEPFDDFYSDETEEWMFKGAVYMNAPQTWGPTSGTDRSQLGPIVHAKCRSESSADGSKKHIEVYYTDG
ncbi:unnamed protein product [Cuscuta epithymum]|uniref:CID domain-containing protein n=1 Tax=Cuscuta epithymum TaxID=186058 RepID=A0AAV0DQ49_9ASTE|nr:unnamed protein product [Cuscuta epithymum]CAH9126054.1 unnamed protein product [Cuscuta epithymum]